MSLESPEAHDDASRLTPTGSSLDGGRSLEHLLAALRPQSPNAHDQTIDDRYREGDILDGTESSEILERLGGRKPNLQVDISHNELSHGPEMLASAHAQSTPKGGLGLISTTPKDAVSTPHQPTNIFVAGIPSSWDDKKLQERFQEFGDIISVRMVPNRHFGFVMFKTPSAAQRAIKGAHLTRPMPSCSALMHVTLSMHDEGMDDVPNERVFVRGLPQWATKDHLRSAFTKFGHIVETSLLMNNAGQCKGAGFVQFLTVEEATAAIEGSHTAHIENYDFELEVKYSETQEVHHQRQERNRERYRFNKGSAASTPTATVTPTHHHYMVPMHHLGTPQNSHLKQQHHYQHQLQQQLWYGTAKPVSYSASYAVPNAPLSPQNQQHQHQPGGMPTFQIPQHQYVLQHQQQHQQQGMGILPSPSSAVFHPPPHHVSGNGQMSPPAFGMHNPQQPIYLVNPSNNTVGTPHSGNSTPLDVSQPRHALVQQQNPHPQQQQYCAPSQHQQQHPMTQQQHPAAPLSASTQYAYAPQQQTQHPPIRGGSEGMVMYPQAFQSGNNSTIMHPPPMQQVHVPSTIPYNQHAQIQPPLPFPASGDLCFTSPVCSDEVIRQVVAQRFGFSVERTALIDQAKNVFAVRLSDRNLHVTVAQGLNNTMFLSGHTLNVALFS